MGGLTTNPGALQEGRKTMTERRRRKEERECQTEIEARKARKLNEKYMVVHSQMTDQKISCCCMI